MSIHIRERIKGDLQRIHKAATQAKCQSEWISQPNHQKVNTTLNVWKGGPDTCHTGWCKQTDPAREFPRRLEEN